MSNPRFKTGILVFVVYMALAAICAASPGPQAGGDIKALISQLNSHYNGFEKVMHNVEIHSHMTGPSGQVMEQAIYWKGKKLRVESGPKQPMAGGAAPEDLFVYNGREAWVFTPQGKHQLTGKDLQDFEAGRSWWWTTLTPQAKITGQEAVNGRDCYVIEPPSGYRMWIDKNALVIRKSESPGPEGKKSYTVYSDFRKVKGWDIPFKQETFIGSQPVSVSVTDSFEAGKDLPDGLFEPGNVKGY
ncbi:MAG: hypothetical protein M0Z52_07620 [Actinomycetota bacterium]|nr:hypothetical protein [Actinomycetota bacterium]